MKRRIALIRHGETEWTTEHRLQGQTDIGLSERGRKQALDIAFYARALKPMHCISSDLTRTKETAAILGLGNVLVDSAWREANLGRWEGLHKHAIDPVQCRAWYDGHFDPPGGESMSDLRTRIGDAIAALKPEGTTVIVTHGGVIRVALAILIGLTANRIIPVDAGSVTVLEGDRELRLKAFNVTGLRD